jgi:formamidopyrimidine-DNA glycosylase
MNQKIISGIGNIYADEICFCAQVLPWRNVASLGEKEIKKLFLCANRVIKTAIKNRGTTFKDFVDGVGKAGAHLNFLNVYGRAGEKCKRCGMMIKKTCHAGRGTHYCAKCQK